MTHATLVDIVAAHAEAAPRRLAVAYLGPDGAVAQSWTWQELYERARTIAACLQQEAATGERVILLYPPGLEFVAAFLGCALGGFVAVPVPAPVRARLRRADERLRDVQRDCDARFVLTDSDLAGAAAALPEGEALFGNARWIATDELPLDAAALWRRPLLDAGALALLQYTSGSTSRPKGVMVSHGNLLANQAQIRRAFRQDADSRVLSWLPHYHDMGLIGGMLQPLYLGVPCYLMAPASFLQSPVRWLRAIDELRITTSGGPNFAYDLCVDRIEPDVRATLDLSSWRVAFNGSEPIRAATLQRFADAYAAHGFAADALHPCYGLAESTLLVSGAQSGPGRRTLAVDSAGLLNGDVRPAGDGAVTQLVASGSVLEPVAVRIVDPADGRLCPPGRVGEIRVASDSVAQGYWNRAEETESTFRSTLDDGRHYLRTGDLGFLDGADLFVTGRLKDLIIIRGANHYPQDIEHTVQQAASCLRPGAGAAFADDSGAVVVLHELQPRHPAPEQLDTLIDDIRAAVAGAHEVALTQVALVRMGQLPMTTSGKIRRAEAARLFRANALDIVRCWPLPEAAPQNDAATAPASASADDILALLRERCAALRGVALTEIPADRPVRLLGVDSLAAAGLAHDVETRFGIPVPLGAFFDDVTLAQLAEQIAAQPREADRPPAPAAETALPLSQGQQALWFLHRLAPASTAYNLYFPCEFTGAVDPAALDAALRDVARRYPVLRSTVEAAEPPRFRVQEIASVMLDRVTVSHADAFDAYVREEALRPFDLATQPPLRARLLRGAGRTALLLSLHHIATDLWSMELFATQLARSYARARASLALDDGAPADTAHHAAWQAALLAGPRGAQLARYWHKQFADGVPPLDLPYDHLPAAQAAVQGARAGLHLDAALTQQLRQVCEARGVTPFSALLAAYALLLGRYSGQREVVVGVPTHGRSRAEFRDSFGYFVNMTGIRAELDADAAAGDFVRGVQKSVAGALVHGDYPLPQLVRDLRPERDADLSPLFQACFALQGGRAIEAGVLAPFVLGRGAAAVRLGELEFAVLPSPPPATPFDLSLVLIENDGAIDGMLQYSPARFAASSMERLLQHYVAAVRQIVADPARLLGAIDLLSPAERERIVVAWNRTQLAVADTGVARQVAQQAAANPQAIALVDGERSLSYAELDREANRLAQVLIARGVRGEDRIAIALPRSIAHVIALLATLKAGAAYVPLDPALPADRLRFIASDSGAVLVIADSELPAFNDVQNAEASATGIVPRLDWSDAEAAMRQADDRAPALDDDPDRLAYVIYTSGSTGTPKGVAVPQRGLNNLVAWHRQHYAIGAQDRATWLAGLGFDASTWELWPYLAAGAQIHRVSDATRLDPSRLREFLDSHAITHAFVPTVLVEPLLRLDPPRALRTLLTGGDALAVRPQDGLPYALVNHYGPTESSVVTTAGVVTPGQGKPTIGTPIANIRTYVLDAGFGPVPAGVSGELCIGGDGLARGYLDRPALTAERFVPDPFATQPGQRLYRTGDRVRHAADGAIEFLGRLDHQVKLRGFRIEPGEIEARLVRHAAVSEALVLLREDVPGDARLVAYLVTTGDTADTSLADALRETLAQQLPEYMVPSAFVLLEAFPLTPNGKLDRKALPIPQATPRDRAAALPSTPTEELLAGIYSQLLRVQPITRDDHFFQLGGHSLLATQLVSRIRDCFDVELPLRAVFEAPVLSALAARIGQTQRGGGEITVARADRTQPLPLSYAQERLWFLEQLDPGKSTYTIPVALRLQGALDETALHQAIALVVQRHEILRSRIVAGPAVVIDSWHDWQWRHVTLDGTAAEREAQARRIAREEADTPFDLAAGPLLRVSFVRIGEASALLLLTFHHIVADGWSMNVLLGEVSQAYEDFRANRAATLPALPIQYVDYAAWQRRYLQGGAEARQLAYWKRQLDGADGMLQLPLDRPRPPLQRFRGASGSLVLDAALSQRIEALAQQHGVTLYMLLLAAFQALLHRHTGQDDLLVGSPIAGRALRATEPLIGFFVNTLVLRARPRHDLPFSELLAQVRETALDAYAHQDLPFERLVEEVQPARSLSHAPLFQVMFALQNADETLPASTGGDAGPGALRLQALPVENTVAKFDQSWTAIPQPQGLRLAVDYNTDLFDAATIDRLLQHYAAILGQIVADPARQIGAIDLLSPVERERIVIGWNQTQREVADVSVARQFAQQAAANPQAIALVDGERSLSYAELDRESNRLAQVLIARGVRGEDRIAIALPRSIAHVIALLATLKAGAAYVPLDPALPADRLRFIAGDSGAVLVIADNDLPSFGDAQNAEVSAIGNIPRLDWSDAEAAMRQADDRAPALDDDPDRLAYVIYTSGSTGTPKGVAVPQRGLNNLVAWHRQHYAIGAQDRATWLAGLGFDASTWELWPYLAAGAQIHRVSDATRLDPSRLREFLDSHAITHAFVPTVLVEPLLRLDPPRALRTLLTGGDALAVRPQDGLPYALVNHYGPTESSVVTTAGVVTPGQGKPTIGTPIANIRTYVLDAGFGPVPAGVSGELCIGGDGLARGYLDRPALTAERFVPDPFATQPGQRLYRTGDRVRHAADGAIEFLGRLDHQVKLRGFRIEPGEIEARLVRHAAVNEALVLLREDVPGDARLVAYLVTTQDTADTGLADALRETLAQQLPEYMVPSAFVLLEAFPLTPNGKLDRKALPIPQATPRDRSAALPSTPTEELLAGIYSQLLHVHPIARDDHFFQLGGHSLLATQLVSQVRALFAIELPLRAVFEAPVLAALAARIDTLQRGGDHAGAGAIPAADRTQPLPLSYAQERLWFLEQMQPGCPIYHMSGTVTLRGELDADALAWALGHVVARHEILRTTFRTAGDGSSQVIGEAVPLQLPFVDLSGSHAADRQDQFRRRALLDVERPFDLTEGPVLRPTLFRFGAQEHVLLFVLHHIAADGWSVGVLTNEVATAYAARVAGAAPALPVLPIQYADFARWQRDWLQGDVLDTQLDYWRGQFREPAPPTQLRTDRPRPAVQTYAGSRLPLRLPAALSARLRALALQENATVFMVLLAGLKALLHRVTGQDDLVVGTLIANRNRGDLEHLIGFFVNALALRTDLSGNPSFRGLLSQVRDVTLGAYAHQDLPFEKIVEAVQPERDLSRTPLFQIALVLQNTPAAAAQLPGLEIETRRFETDTSAFDISFTLDDGDEIAGTVEYNTDLYDAATIARLLHHYRVLLDAAARTPDASLQCLPLLTAQEQDEILVAWNRTDTAHPLDRCFHELFEQRVRETPDAPAASHGTRTLSYRELNQRANRCAHALIRAGARAEDVVAVFGTRDLDFLAVMLGIFKAGACYLPLDPAHPPARLRQILGQARARFVAAADSAGDGVLARALESMPDAERPQRLRFEVCTDATLPPHDPALAIAPQRLAYVIFTSGSTGLPKGAMIHHAGMLNHLHIKVDDLALTPQDVVAQTASQCFDISVWQFLSPLLAGGRVHIYGEDAARDPALLLATTAQQQVSVLEVVPSLLRELVEEIRVASAPPDLVALRWMVATGEALPPDIVRGWLQRYPDKPVLNAYGPTECSDDVTHHVIRSAPRPGEDLIPIGHALGNTRLYILDPALQPVPVGIAGRLHVGGAGVGRGYLHSPLRTAQAFLPDPFGASAGARIYDTGDLARYLPNGDIEFLGRVDHQVKIRGFRIELGEIEAALLRQPGVHQAVVVAVRPAGAADQLAAYIEFKTEADAEEEAPEAALTDQIEHWQLVFDSVYKTSGETDETLDVSGWTSSYDGQPIPRAQMREWVEGTVDNIVSRAPRKVLELGCGTGMLLQRIAPGCEEYWGSDLTRQSIDGLTQLVARTPQLANTRLFHRPADDFTDIPPRAFDAVVVNSVVQYFPHVDYLMTVLERAVESVRDGGFLYLGDIRCLPMLEALHFSLAHFNAEETASLDDLRRAVRGGMDQERELIVDPAFFHALRQHLPRVAGVELQLKRGVGDNELTGFRYDVVLHVGTAVATVAEADWIAWNDTLDPATVMQQLATQRPPLLALRGVPNARVQRERAGLAWLHGVDSEQTRRDAEELIRAAASGGVAPETWREAARAVGYAAAVHVNARGDLFDYDVVLTPAHSAPLARPLPQRAIPAAQPWRALANNPLRELSASQRIAAIRDQLRQVLPDYMVPSTFTALARMPLTANGKIDRRSLPKPVHERPDDLPFIAPAGQIEETIAAIWRQVLEVERVGSHDRFFDIGGDSLKIVKVYRHLDAAFPGRIGIVDLFKFNTVKELGDHVAAASPQAAPSVAAVEAFEV